MKPLILFCILLLNLSVAFAQDKKTTKNGEVHFEASVPSFEEVKARNANVSCLLNVKTGEISSLAMIKEFRFKIPLMEEHFNSNFLESNRYPKATFKGVIENFNPKDLGNTPKEFKLNGKLKMHGKTKTINQTATVRRINEGIEITSVFNINASDFDIKIPEILSQKISKTITLRTTFLVK